MPGNRSSAMQLLSQTHGTPRKMRSGGAVHGPGTGTSDSIPALLSNGEYVLPADTVAHVGRPALDALRSLTHTPVQKFADGGLVDNPYGAVTRTGNSYSGMDVRGSISVNGQAPGGTYNENPAGRGAASVLGTMPAAAPVGAAPAVAGAPVAAAAAAPAAGGWADRNAQRNNAVTASSILASPERDAARAALMGGISDQATPPATTAAPRPQVATSAAAQLSALPATSARPAMSAAGGGWQASNDARSNAVTASSLMPSAERDAALRALGQTSAIPKFADGGLVEEDEFDTTGDGLGTAAALMGSVGSVPAAAPASGQGANPAGGPLARSVATMSAPQPAMSAQQALSSLPQPQVPVARHSGNDWQARKDLANLQTAASSITNDPRYGGAGERSDASQAYQRALATDLALKGSGPELEQSAMRERGANARAMLSDLGSTQRTVMEQSGAGARALLADTGSFQRQALQNQGALDRQAVQSAGTVQAAQLRAAQAAGKAPEGYRWASNGVLEAITGGPADQAAKEAAKPLNDVQSKALQFGARMQTAGQTLDELAADGVDRAGDIKRAADAINLGAAANWSQSAKQQQVEQAQRDYVNAVLRRESGAAIANSEFENAKKQYFPQIGDSPEVIAQKRRNREIATAGVLAEVPNAERRVGQVVGAAQPKKSQRPALDSFWEK